MLALFQGHSIDTISIEEHTLATRGYLTIENKTALQFNDFDITSADGGRVGDPKEEWCVYFMSGKKCVINSSHDDIDRDLEK